MPKLFRKRSTNKYQTIEKHIKNLKRNLNKVGDKEQMTTQVK